MIFYFTGTGNSKFIADRIASAIGEQVVDIAACVQGGQYSFELGDDEKVGFVVPVYYYGIPMIVAEFLEKLEISADHDLYSYAILNCGGTTGDSGRHIQRAFKVNAIFGIVTVDNYVPMYKVADESKVNERLNAAEREIDKIIAAINYKVIGTSNTVSGRLPRLLTTSLYPIYKNGRKTKKFRTNEKCTGCKSCELLCPRRIIECSEGKPVWTKPQCEECLACLHRCPSAAIEFGKSAGRGRYVNPRVVW